MLALDPLRLITQYGIRHWDSSSGLPQNSALAIAQDRDGYIWLGTEEGLARFDGSRFVVFTPTNLPQLHSRVIRSIAVSSDGDLWCATEGGVLRKHGAQFIGYTTSEGLQQENVRSIRIDG